MIVNRLKELIATILAIEPSALPQASTPLRDIEDWDSLKHVALVVGLQRDFKVTLTAPEIRAMVTMADIERILQEKGADGA